MKKAFSLLFAFIAILFSFSVVFSSCDKGSQTDVSDEFKSTTVSNISEDCSCLVNPAASITPEEEDMIRYMREEEKLARDVYVAFFEQYEINIFNNIARSEQRHMDAILCLLEHYGIEDPASSEAGVFNDPVLQNLYDDLINQGAASLDDALTVGATIEDVDIFDLEGYVNQTSNEAILNIFGRLKCGSRNHMRAFSGLLSDNGLSYTPQYISQEDYDAIIEGSNEMCGNGNGPGNGNGNGSGNCNGGGNGNGNNGNGGNGNGGNGNGNGGNCNGGNGGNGNGGNCP